MDEKTLVNELNKDLAGELSAVIQYTIYAALCKGPYRPQLKTFFEAEIPDELGHAQFLADHLPYHQFCGNRADKGSAPTRRRPDPPHRLCGPFIGLR